MREPVDHILRPRLPWREGEGITECGYDASKVKVLTREEYLGRLKDWGRQRTALLTCMTCLDTAGRWGTWEDDPRRAIEREIMWETYGGYYREERGRRLRDELCVIAQLVERHREEFDAGLAALAQRREWLERKKELERKRGN